LRNRIDPLDRAGGRSAAAGVWYAHAVLDRLRGA
jgi:hypothetical protein